MCVNSIVLRGKKRWTIYSPKNGVLKVRECGTHPNCRIGEFSV